MVDYWVKKWLKFNFVVTPTELEAIFKDLDYFIAVTNQRVPLDYKITDKTSIFREYSLFFQRVVSGKEWQKDWNSVPICTSLTTNPNHIKYAPFEIEEENKIKKFKKVVAVEESLISIGVFSLMIDHKDRLTTAYFDTQGNSLLGLQFSYPKEIYLNEKNMETKNFSTYNLYNTLIHRIKKKTKKVKAMRNGKQSKPNFWLSEKVLSEINNNFNLLKNNIVLS